MDNNVKEPTTGGSIREIDFKTDKNNKVIEANIICGMRAYENPNQEEEKIVGTDPIVIGLELDREEERE